MDKEFSGVVYDTASISTMHALAAAREEASTSVRTLGLSGRSELPIFRVYTSDQAHSSVEKAAIALGLGEHNVRRIPSDAEFRMDVAALRETVAADLRKEFLPLAVVATVGIDFHRERGSCEGDRRCLPRTSNVAPHRRRLRRRDRAACPSATG